MTSSFPTYAPPTVVWHTPRDGPSDSMPIGNGDIGLNVWTEKSGDLVFTIGKTDAWEDNARLAKVGQIRVIDPSNASFTRLYETMKLGGWSPELCEAHGVGLDQLPEIREADEVVGRLTPAAARLLGLRAGTPVMTD